MLIHIRHCERSEAMLIYIRHCERSEAMLIYIRHCERSEAMLIYIRHCERSEAIQKMNVFSLDCHVVLRTPRNDKANGTQPVPAVGTTCSPALRASFLLEVGILQVLRSKT